MLPKYETILFYSFFGEHSFYEQEGSRTIDNKEYPSMHDDIELQSKTLLSHAIHPNSETPLRNRYMALPTRAQDPTDDNLGK